MGSVVVVDCVVVEVEVELEVEVVGCEVVVELVLWVDVEVAFAQSVAALLVTVSVPSSRLLRNAESTLPGSPLTTARRRLEAVAVCSQSPAAIADSTSLSAELIEPDWAWLSRPAEDDEPQPVTNAAATIAIRSASDRVLNLGIFYRC